MRQFLAPVLIVMTACAELPSEPALHGPAFAAPAEEAEATPTSPRELSWFHDGKMIRITKTSRLCRKEAEDAGVCVRLSAADRRRLDAFFGTPGFRQRWSTYSPCPLPRGTFDEEVFAITFEDGERVAKRLNTQFGLARACDGNTRHAVTAVADDLVRRYF